jgi:hypothetical protein
MERVFLRDAVKLAADEMERLRPEHTISHSDNPNRDAKEPEVAGQHVLPATLRQVEQMAAEITSLRADLDRMRDERDEAVKRAESERRLTRYYGDLAQKYSDELYDDRGFISRKELHFWQGLAVATAVVAVIFGGIALI